jgi:hypothetical protein
MKRAQVADWARRRQAEVRMKVGERLAAQRNLRFTEELLQVNLEALDLLQSRVSQGAAPPLADGYSVPTTTEEEKRRMKRMLMGIAYGVVLFVGFLATVWGDDLKVMQTQKAKDLTITLLSESGQWTQGKSTFVLEFTSASTKQPVDVGKATMSTRGRFAPHTGVGGPANMEVPGMGPMVTGATMTFDKTPGRYLCTISFPDSGVRQLTVAWSGPAGKGSTQFSIPVR